MAEYRFDERGNEILPEPKSVSFINNYIKGVLEDEQILKNIYVCGEVSNFKNHFSSGHWYFSLKDEKSEIKALMFKSDTKKVRFMPENGMKIIVLCSIGVYSSGGTYQLIVKDIMSDGKGSLYLAFEQLKKRLSEEGLFAEEHKRQLPKYPKRIGVVTSASGAAIKDIIHVTKRRYPIADIVLYPAVVQGEGSAESVIKGIEIFNCLKSVDVIIIGRGGGSIEDLWSFNDEGLARTIYNSEIPIISAVGHEIDYTIADFVADVRAATPSAAAEIATPDINEIMISVDDYINKTFNMLLNNLNKKRDRLDNLKNRRVLLDYDYLFQNKSVSVSNLKKELIFAFSDICGKKEKILSSLIAKLDTLSPLSVLSRGYCVVLLENKAIKSIENVKKDEQIEVLLSDGYIEAKITDTHKERII